MQHVPNPLWAIGSSVKEDRKGGTDGSPHLPEDYGTSFNLKMGRIEVSLGDGKIYSSACDPASLRRYTMRTGIESPQPY